MHIKHASDARAIRAMALAIMVALVGCGGMQDTGHHEGVASAEPTAVGAAAQARIDLSILDDPGRPDEEKSQDASRKALDIYAWLGIRPGMTVADLFCSGGYNTHLLSKVVGKNGKVYGVFEFYANKEVFDGQLYKVDELGERVAKNALDNVELLTKVDELPGESLDALLVVRNYHDVEWVFDSLKRQEVVASVYRALKPGGVVGIVEVATDREGWDEKTHRLNEKVVIEDFTSGGFRLLGRSDMLANKEDDHSIAGFKEGRHTLDRYLLKFEKPS